MAVTKRKSRRPRPRPRRRRRVAKPRAVQHNVDAKLQQSFPLTLEGSALKFEIRDDSRKLGTLTIGRGSLGWKGRSDQRVLPLGWELFVRLMERERKRRKSRRR